MMTSTISSIEEHLDNMTGDTDVPAYVINAIETDRSKSCLICLSKLFLRLICIFVFISCPWANFKLIQLFQTREFYKESSAKWYIIFKGIFDTIFMLISVPIFFFLTFNIDIIHKNSFTCKTITYVHYLSDDLISIMLTLLCIDRMIRITCGYHLQKRFSLIICIITTSIFILINIHHIVRLRFSDGFCHKEYNGFWDYDFDIYYSFIYTSITWIIIFLASINLLVSIYCDRVRINRLKQQQHQQQSLNKIYSNTSDNDQLGLIHNTDDWQDPTVVTIEQINVDNKIVDQQQQDNIDLQLTICVLITSAIFLSCNLPNFIMFIIRFIFHSGYTTISFIFVYISVFPLFIAHTISYFIFNHLAARLFSNNNNNN